MAESTGGGGGERKREGKTAKRKRDSKKLREIKSESEKGRDLRAVLLSSIG